MSRCQVYLLKSLEKADLLSLLSTALKKDPFLKEKKIEIKETEALLRYSGGDARILFNLLELTVNAVNEGEILIDNELVVANLQEKMALYDKSGEQHYDIISAFIKSVRGSDPNAAVYWLARMIEGGDYPKFIARRMIILAAEDIGMANPNALLLATACFDAIHVIGMPEGRIILSETAIYLATSPKSNSSYLAIDEALAFVRETGDLSVPLNIRNAPTSLMKELGYGKEYKYAHSFAGHFAEEEFLPEEIKGKTFYEPADNPRESEIRSTLLKFWKERYKY